MFNNKTRARVPSAATLRVLYQLAYISSGTAVGFATLCAEERRRRTIILQKIADNARRIRQSPRHISNAALARSEEPADWVHGDLGSRVMDDGENNSMKGYLSSDATARDARLPSVVEKGYDRVVAINARRPQQSDFPINETRHNRVDDPPHPNKTPPQWPSDISSTHDVTYREYRRGTGKRLRRIGAIEPRKKVGHSVLESQPKFRTLKVADGDMAELAENVKSDVDLFFRCQPWSRRGNKQEVRIADHLLAKALECGSLAEVRSVYEWKLQRIGLSHQDLRQICEACSRLAAQRDREAVLKFYVELLATSSFVTAPERLQYQLAFALAAEMTTWEITLTNRELIDTLLGPLVSESRTSGRRTDTDALHNSLDMTVRGLVASHHLDAAINLIISTSKFEHELTIPLADLAFDAARQAGRLALCHQILDWKYAHHQTQETSMHQYECFIRMCDEQRAYRMLNRIIGSLANSNWFGWLVTGLSAQARLVLATACTVQKNFPRDTFRKLYENIPKDVSGSLSEVHSTLQLQTLWETTRDLNTVKVLFNELCNSALLDKQNAGISINMVEILSSANQPDQALELLQVLRSSHVERTRLACLAAEAMARKKAWGQVDKLLDAIPKTGEFIAQNEGFPELNRIAHLFCHQHRPQESWNYIKSLMRRFSFRPNKSAVMSLLQCFVTHESLHMIPPCLEHLQNCGVKFRLDTEVAATLLSIYAWLQRPTHTVMMELCRNLVIIAPWLDRTKFIRVVEETIAFDLRSASRKSKNSIKFWAEKNLAQLNEPHESGLPSPHWSHTVLSLTGKISTAIDSGLPSGLNSGSISVTTTAKSRERRASAFNQETSSERSERDGDLVRSSRDHRCRRRAEQEMILAFSRNDHKIVLELYQKYLEPNGLPLSPVALEVAVESALRRGQDDDSEASALLEDAKRAGMNISCAMGPILIHKMRHFTTVSNQDASQLRNTVIDYYRTNEENGWKVRHNVGVYAADTLAQSCRPSSAINLLNSIYYSHWVTDRPLDITAMTVYVKSYSFQRSIQGVSWAVDKVLHSNMRIDDRFTKALKNSLEFFDHKNDKGGDSETDHCAYIRELRHKCLQAKQKQRKMAKAFGVELVQCIAKCSLPEQTLGERHEKPSQKPLNIRHEQYEDGFQMATPTALESASASS